MTHTLTLPEGPWPSFDAGWVWLCGTGPGDPGLLTLHALNALSQADVVIYDALVDSDILDWAPDALHLFSGKRGGRASASQPDVTQMLVTYAKLGKRVLRLKGGDPFVFGRGAEEAEVLVEHAIPFRIIPGITAGIGGLAYAGIPATHRDVNQSITFITGHDHTGQTPASLDWAALAQASQVLVIYMGLKHAARISAALMAAGRNADEPAAIIVSATTAAQRVYETTLSGLADVIAEKAVVSPAVICIGGTVPLRGMLNWQGPAGGQTP